MTIHLGNVPAGTTLYVPFSTYDANGASVTMTGLTTAKILVYKNGSTTQRASTAGFALLDTDGTDFDGITGLQAISIDLSDNTDAGFYAAGSFYWIVISTVTIATQTVTLIPATFRIVSAENTAGYPVSDVAKINNVATTSVTTINANIGQTQPLNFTGTGASALVKGDAIDINSVAATAVTAINANIGTTQPVNFTGTGASALAKSDMVDVAGAAVSTSTAQIGVNVIQAAGTAWGSGAITAAAFAANSVNANALATDAVTEIATGTLTATMTESYAANGAAMTPAQALHAIHQMLMDFTISGTTWTVKKLDNTTTAFIATLNDASNPTGIART